MTCAVVRCGSGKASEYVTVGPIECDILTALPFRAKLRFFFLISINIVQSSCAGVRVRSGKCCEAVTLDGTHRARHTHVLPLFRNRCHLNMNRLEVCSTFFEFIISCWQHPSRFRFVHIRAQPIPNVSQSWHTAMSTLQRRNRHDFTKEQIRIENKI